MSIKERILNNELFNKISTAEEAAASINNGDNVGVSGFTPAGYPKAVPLALAQRIKNIKHTEGKDFKINLFSGASTGPEIDHSLTEVNGINKRIPYQTTANMRDAINCGKLLYKDISLGKVAQKSRAGVLCGHLDVAIIEAIKITPEGYIVPSTAVGNSPSFVKTAKRVIVEINTAQSVELEGMHDIFVLDDPPNRKIVPITHPNEKIGTDYIVCDPNKISHVVVSNIPDTARPLAAIDDNARAITRHLEAFLKEEIEAGRIPTNLLPLQSGVGSVANAVLSGLAQSDFKDLTVYTEVLQDGILDLIDVDKMDFASGTSLTLSPEGFKRFNKDIKKYREKILLRPQEISNNIEVIQRLGVIALNTAIEVDIYGNVNSTHIMGTKIMNGIGGSSDFSSSAYITIFFTNSTAKGGKISSIVPMCSHVDHTEHVVNIIITEQGVADLRGLAPKERARLIIENCAHPDYKKQLLEYLERAEKATNFTHTPHLLKDALSFHTKFLETGSMLD